MALLKWQILESLKLSILMVFLSRTLLLEPCLTWYHILSDSVSHSLSHFLCYVSLSLCVSLSLSPSLSISQAPERIANEQYSFPGDIWSFGLSLLAVVQGRFPFTSEGQLDYWELYRLICEEEAPSAGDAFSEELNLLIASCLLKNPMKRPTAAMLMQHPFFLKHANVIVRSAERNQLKTTPKSDLHPLGGRPKNPAMNILSAEDFDDTTSVPSQPKPMRPTPHHTGQSALARVTEERLSRVSSRPTTPSYSSIDISTMDEEEENVINCIRFQHLEAILEKIDSRYQHYALLKKREREKQRQQQQQQHQGGFGGGNTASERHGSSSCRSMMSASMKSFFKSSHESLTPVPSLTSYSGRLKWQYFASQLHLTLGTVTDNASRIISPKFISKS
jgi:serine/threonine protein kinase